MTDHLFLMGTHAEFIKMFPLIAEAKARHLSFEIIASGQNDIWNNPLWQDSHYHGVDHRITQPPTKASETGVFTWWWQALFLGGSYLGKLLKKYPKKPWLIVHGDTLTTLLGAILAKRFGLNLAHIEAGLRSKNIWKPFPEEICRRLVSHATKVSYCPNMWSKNNLGHINHDIVVTEANTLYDAVYLMLQKDFSSLEIRQKIGLKAKEKYFFCSIHRQENIVAKDKLRLWLQEIMKICQEIPALFIGHASTLQTLKDIKLLEQLENHPNIHITPRLPYEACLRLLKEAEFAISDGGSNQEEAYYLGLPTFILRDETERIEGLGDNILLSTSMDKMKIFYQNSEKFRRPPLKLQHQPSKLIAEDLLLR